MKRRICLSLALTVVLYALPALPVTFSDFSGVNGVTSDTFLRQMGVSVVRFDISWRDIERIPGVYDWAATDRKVQALHQSGFQILPLLAYTPAWNRLIAGSTGSPPIDYSAWLRFVRAAVQRYGSPPWDLVYFQIWNEPTRRASFWLGSNDEFISRIYIPAARIIRAAGKKVVFGGWPASNTISEFDRLLTQSGAVHYTDILDFHYGGETRYNLLYDRYIRTGLVQGIWQTEVGYITEPQGVLQVWLHNLHWSLTHQWQRADQYKIFWYPAWESRKARYHGLTTTVGRQIVLTDKGRQLRLLNRIYGNGNLSSAQVDSNIEPLPQEKQFFFGTTAGDDRIIIAVSLSAGCPGGRCKFIIKTHRVPRFVRLIVPDYVPVDLKFTRTKSEIHVELLGGGYSRRKRNSSESIFYKDVSELNSFLSLIHI